MMILEVLILLNSLISVPCLPADRSQAGSIFEVG